MSNEPIRWDRTIYTGTDHTWTLRRKDDEGNLIIPTSGRSQVRQRPSGELWVEAEVQIDTTDGWVKVIIPKEDTESADWDTRTEGVWDLEVIVAGATERWAMGRVEVSPNVTR